MDRSKLCIAMKIRQAREMKGITQVAMAQRLGVARQTYLDLETGKTEPRISMLMMIADITERSIYWFILDAYEHDVASEYDNLQKLLSLFTQIPLKVRGKLIEQNVNLISSCVDYVAVEK